jgi:hypothetical protein
MGTELAILLMCLPPSILLFSGIPLLAITPPPPPPFICTGVVPRAVSQDSGTLDRLTQDELRVRLDTLDEHFRKDVAMLSDMYEKAREAIEAKLSKLSNQ